MKAPWTHLLHDACKTWGSHAFFQQAAHLMNNDAHLMCIYEQ